MWYYPFVLRNNHCKLFVEVLFFAPRFELHASITDPQNSAEIEIKRSKRLKKIKESNTTSIPLIPSHSKMESKQSKSREIPGKSETLTPTRKICL